MARRRKVVQVRWRACYSIGSVFQNSRISGSISFTGGLREDSGPHSAVISTSKHDRESRVIRAVGRRTRRSSQGASESNPPVREL